MVFVIREVGRENEILVESCETGKEGQEEVFKTHQQAHNALEQLKGAYPFINLVIINLSEKYDEKGFSKKPDYTCDFCGYPNDENEYKRTDDGEYCCESCYAEWLEKNKE